MPGAGSLEGGTPFESMGCPEGSAKAPLLRCATSAIAPATPGSGSTGGTPWSWGIQGGRNGPLLGDKTGRDSPLFKMSEAAAR